MKKLLLALFFLSLSAVAANAANRFGVCATTCTWNGASTAMWSTTTGGATGASVPGASDDVIFDAATCVGGTTCTITVNTNPTIISLTMGACTGTTTGCILDFSVNNNSPTLTGNVNVLSITGTGTRTLKMGSGTFTFNNTASAVTLIVASTTTNLTLTPGTSTIKVTGNSAFLRTLATGASLIWGNLWIDANSAGGGVVLSQNAVTFADIKLTAPTQLLLPQSNTITATSLTFNGSSSATNLLMSNSFISRSTISVASATQTLLWTGISGVTFTGGATFVANNSFNIGPNTGITITAPSSFGGGACIIGGWLLWRDLPEHINDNFPAWIEKAA